MQADLFGQSTKMRINRYAIWYLVQNFEVVYRKLGWDWYPDARSKEENRKMVKECSKSFIITLRDRTVSAPS